MDVTEEQVQRTFLERLDDYTEVELLCAVGDLMEHGVRRNEDVPVLIVTMWLTVLATVGARREVEYDAVSRGRVLEIVSLMREVVTGTLPVGDVPS